MTDLGAIIRGRFPNSLVELFGFDDWYEDIRQLVQSGAADFVHEIEGFLEKEGRRFRQEEGKERDHWYVFRDEKAQESTLLKSAESVRSKLARDLADDGDGRKDRLTEHEIRMRILGLSDLGRCRIVCTFNQDAVRLRQALFSGNKKVLGKYQCPGGVEDFIFDQKRRDGMKGHRARQFSVRIPLSDAGTFGFEVQLMTALQHAWDRRNHPFYEHIREGGKLTMELKVNDFACAETLHLVDQQADQNWRCFLEETEPR